MQVKNYMNLTQDQPKLLYNTFINNHFSHALIILVRAMITYLK